MAGNHANGTGPGSGNAPIPPVTTRRALDSATSIDDDDRLTPPFFGTDEVRPKIDPARGAAAEPQEPIVPADTTLGSGTGSDSTSDSDDDVGLELTEPVEPEGQAEPDAAGDNVMELDAVVETGATGAPAPEAAAPPDAPAPNPAAPSGDAVDDPVIHEVADRLEGLAERLRAEGSAAVGAGLADGDRLDALLSSMLTGYLAGRKG